MPTFRSEETNICLKGLVEKKLISLPTHTKIKVGETSPSKDSRIIRLEKREEILHKLTVSKPCNTEGKESHLACSAF